MRSKVFKVVVGVMLAVLVLGGLVQAKEIELSFWNGFTGPDGKGMGQMVDEFNKLNAGKIKVEMQVITWGEYYQKVVTALSSGKAPDVGIMHIDRLPEFASKNVLMPLNDVIATLKWSSKDFAKPVWDAGMYKGQRYGIPLDMHPLAMFINVDLFKKAGLDPKKPPKTMDEFMKAVKALTKDTDGDGKTDQWGTAIPAGWPGPQFIGPTVIHQFGGSYTNADVTKVTYNSPQAIKGLQFLVDLIYKHQVSPSNIQQDGEVTLFRQGKLGIHFNGIWMINGFKEQAGLNFMSYPVPNLGGKMAVTGGSHNFVLFRQAKKDDAKRQAAVEFIKFIAKNSAKWAEFGQIPANNAVRSSKAFTSLTHQASIANEVPSMVFPPIHPALNEVMTPLQEEINLALLGKKSAEQALNDAAARAQKALDAYNSSH